MHIVREHKSQAANETAKPIGSLFFIKGRGCGQGIGVFSSFFMFPMCSNQVAFKTQCVQSMFPQVPNEFLKIFPIVVVSTISELPFYDGPSQLPFECVFARCSLSSK
jgi:hypothetical protein